MALETDVRAHYHLALVLRYNFFRLPPATQRTPASNAIRALIGGCLSAIPVKNTAFCRLTARSPLQ